MKTKCTLILNIRNSLLKLLGHMMREEGLKNLALTGQDIVESHDRPRPECTRYIEEYFATIPLQRNGFSLLS